MVANTIAVPELGIRFDSRGGPRRRHTKGFIERMFVEVSEHIVHDTVNMSVPRGGGRQGQLPLRVS